MSAPHAVMPARNHSSLSISIVTYQADYDALEKTLQSLISAAAQAKQRQWVQTLELQLIDNGPQIADQARMTRLAAREQANALWDQVRLFTGHGNVGYGMGHNLGIRESTCVFHLILNPDVVLQVDALEQAISYMEQHEEAAIVVPAVYSEQGEREYLCKAYPSVLDLLIRGFAPSWMKPWFAARLARYEMHHVVAANEVAPVPLGSGAFMFCRTSVLQASLLYVF